MCHQHKVVKRNNDFVLTCHFLPILEVKSFFEYDMRIYSEIYCDIESRCYQCYLINTLCVLKQLHTKLKSTLHFRLLMAFCARSYIRA